MTKLKQECYSSPEMEVIETTADQIICQSGGINAMTSSSATPW